jgi:hypothetical protein
VRLTDKKDQAIIPVALSINAQEHATCFESCTNYYNKTLKILPTPGFLGKFLQFVSSSNVMQRVFRCFCQFVQANWESPRRKHTTYRTRRKFEIKKLGKVLLLDARVTIPGFPALSVTFSVSFSAVGRRT